MLEWATSGKGSIRKPKKMSVFMYLLYIRMDAVSVYEWVKILCMKSIVVSTNLRYFYSVLDEIRHWSRWLLHYSSEHANAATCVCIFTIEMEIYCAAHG
jgi:hypothetical protein